MNNNMNPVVHFEMGYKDKQRAVNFYTKVFGWKAKMMGPEMGNYVVVTTTETDEQRMIKQPGAINGGFYKKEKAKHYPSIVIAVVDITQAMQRVRDAGGQILGGRTPDEPDDIPGIGLYASFIDTEGNRVGMLQPVRKQ